MKRYRRAISAGASCVAVATLAVCGAQAKNLHKYRHHAPATHLASLQRPLAFPTYIDHGSDYNPNGDDLYFNDTKRPNYIVGPAWFQRWEDR